MNDVANAIRLYKSIYKTWQSAVAETDSDEKVIQDFLKQNTSYRKIVPDLIRLLNSNDERKSTKSPRRQSRTQ